MSRISEQREKGREQRVGRKKKKKKARRRSSRQHNETEENVMLWLENTPTVSCFE